MNGNTLNYISYLNLICDSKMCGWFAGQFSRDNRRDIYISWTDLLCIHSFLSFLNHSELTCLSRLHLLRRRGTRKNIAPWSRLVNCSLDLSSWCQYRKENPYLQYQTGLSRDCDISCGIVRVHQRKWAKAETSDDHRAHHHRRIPHLVSEP